MRKSFTEVLYVTVGGRRSDVLESDLKEENRRRRSCTLVVPLEEAVVFQLGAGRNSCELLAFFLLSPTSPPPLSIVSLGSVGETRIVARNIRKHFGSLAKL